MDGGTGNDYMDGGIGNDRYLFGIGSGQDTIRDYSSASDSANAVVFVKGLTQEDIDWVKSGNDLMLVIKSSGDSLRIKGWFESSNYQIERFEFADGTVWTKADIETAGYSVYGTEENNYFYGSDAKDSLFSYNFV